MIGHHGRGVMNKNGKEHSRGQQVPTRKAVDRKSASHQCHSLASPPRPPGFNTRVKIDRRKPELCLPWMLGYH